MLNVDSSVQQYDVGQVYNVRANSLLEDEYPQLQVISTLHKVDDTISQFNSLCDGKPGGRSHLLI